MIADVRDQSLDHNKTSSFFKDKTNKTVAGFTAQ
jgi:hypothetical protein